MRLTLEQLKARRIEIQDQLRGTHILSETLHLLEAIIILDAEIRKEGG
jgi:hypothetical protein